MHISADLDKDPEVHLGYQARILNAAARDSQQAAYSAAVNSFTTPSGQPLLPGLTLSGLQYPDQHLLQGNPHQGPAQAIQQENALADAFFELKAQLQQHLALSRELDRARILQQRKEQQVAALQRGLAAMSRQLTMARRLQCYDLPAAADAAQTDMLERYKEGDEWTAEGRQALARFKAASGLSNKDIGPALAGAFRFIFDGHDLCRQLIPDEAALDTITQEMSAAADGRQDFDLFVLQRLSPWVESKEEEIDKIGELQAGPNLHVFSADYDVYALPKGQLNMASFVTTWMEPEAIKLIEESLNVNLVDLDEYPSCTDIHQRCVAMLADLYNSPVQQQDAIGAAAIGSSEAIMLAGLAMKKNWQNRRKAAGLPYDKPNMVMAYSVQVCWEKFCRYFDVEEKYVPLEEGRYVITPELARELVDENTIGVVGILDQASITLNFSRGASHVIAQYYQLLRLGRAGYERIMNNLDTIAKRLADGILETGEFEILSKPVGVPLVAFRLKKRSLANGDTVERSYDEFDVSDRLKEFGWVLPAYSMAPNAKHVKLLRAVIRVDHSMTLVEKLIGHIHEAMRVLNLREQTSEKHFEKLREQLNPHRREDNPHRQVKTTSQC
eukprot:gene4515-4768_t